MRTPIETLFKELDSYKESSIVTWMKKRIIVRSVSRYEDNLFGSAPSTETKDLLAILKSDGVNVDTKWDTLKNYLQVDSNKSKRCYSVIHSVLDDIITLKDEASYKRFWAMQSVVSYGLMPAPISIVAIGVSYAVKKVGKTSLSPEEQKNVFRLVDKCQCDFKLPDNKKKAVIFLWDIVNSYNKKKNNNDNGLLRGSSNPSDKSKRLRTTLDVFLRSFENLNELSQEKLNEKIDKVVEFIYEQSESGHFTNLGRRMYVTICEQLAIRFPQQINNLSQQDESGVSGIPLQCMK